MTAAMNDSLETNEKQKGVDFTAICAGGDSPGTARPQKPVSVPAELTFAEIHNRIFRTVNLHFAL
jgi:hypothetical protein